MSLTTNEKVSIAVGAVAVSGIIFGVYKYKMSDGANPVSSSNSVVLVSAPHNSSANLALPIPAIKFAIGKYNSDYGQGWRKATAADWTDSKFQKELVEDHNNNGGWFLLEEPLVCDAPLYVAKGMVQIDNIAVAEIKHLYDNHQLKGVYTAKNYLTNEAWTTHPPKLGDNWTVENWEVDYNPPACLSAIQYLLLAKKHVGIKNQKLRNTENANNPLNYYIVYYYNTLYNHLVCKRNKTRL
jgi:hypothetical protein